ncbi:MAG: LysM peptidoglycan-binding domain-containing protein [Bacteroidetes bacterium]|nr:LysM peptidoglycan-binding domain-containing protein [Bacteroidota bacterium]
MKKTILIAIIGLFAFDKAHAQNMSREAYISAYAKWAVLEMYEYGIPASITLAQGILESGSGNSDLAKFANNHFGIKCHKGWEGLKYYHDDDSIQECFRVYPTVLESYRDHSLFLRTRSRYAGLFELDRTDYVGWARGLKAAGYATNPKYPEMLILSIEDFDLYEYDMYPDPRPEEIANAQSNQKVIKKDTLTNKPVEEEILIVNGRKCVKIKKGFNVAELSFKHNISVSKLYKYNDIISEEMLDTGMYFFLEKKENEGQVDFHKVKTGESMFQLAQMYGVKLQRIYDLNLMEKYMQPMVGEMIYLRYERDTAPKVRTYYEVIQERDSLIEKRKQLEMRRRSGIEKAVVEQRYRLQIEQLKNKNKDEEIKLAEMEYQINKLKKEQEKFQKNKESRKKEIERLEQEEREKQEIKLEEKIEEKKEVFESNPSDNSPKTPIFIKTTSDTNSSVKSKAISTNSIVKPGDITHIVGQGETLFSIARKYSVSLSELKENNMMGDDLNIKIGQEIIIQKKR